MAIPGSSTSTPPASAAIFVPVSHGEIFDKITILEIKSDRITDSTKLANVRTELTALQKVVLERIGVLDSAATDLVRQLRTVNEKLWVIEDDIRVCETQSDFGAKFIELARAVYVTNDHRAVLKKQINVLLHSELMEEKHFSTAG